MSLIVPDEGEVRLLDMLTNAVGMSSVRLRLFKNNLTPAQGTVYSDFTEATFSGYASATPAFGAAATVSHKGTITDAASRSFTHNGGATSNTIYGYYVVDTGTSKVLWAERFSPSQALANFGDKITITLAFTLNSEN